MRFVICTMAMVASLPVLSVSAQSNVDPDHRWAWSEIGWLNWHDAGDGADGATVSPTFLSGLIWSESAGWINLGDGSPDDGVAYANVDGLDFGVNVDPTTGSLSGLAWGEQTGWISMGTVTRGDQNATFEFCENRFSGYAWGEAMGWLHLDDATHVVALGPVCEVGDVVCDEMIALPDFALFEQFLEGPGVDVSCPLFDHDDDGDIDLADFAIFQSVFTGS